MRAKDIMTTKVATVGPETTVEAISEMMLSRNVSGIPVVETDGAIVGIVTEGDLLIRKEVGAESAQHTSWWLCFLSDGKADAANYIKTHGLRAAEIMSRDVITVGEDMPVGDIARILAERKIKRVPVVRHGKVVGIVRRVNLLRGLASRDRSQSVAPTVDDRTIKDAVLQEVDRQGWVTHGSLNVIVTGGIVEMWGWVESPQERHALLLLAESIEGVKSVKDHLGSVPRYLQSD